MVSDPRDELRMPLRGAAADIVLQPDAVRHPRDARGHGRRFTRYDDITHLVLSERYLWIASERRVDVLSRALFPDPADPGRLLAELRRRIAARPGGEARLARMEQIDALAERPWRAAATWTFAILCALTFAAQWLLQPEATLVGLFSGRLVADGDLWRIVTGNLLHGPTVHLAVNLIGLLLLGRLVERVLGMDRTICVMGASAVGGMLSSAWADPGDVYGASGVVLGLAGAMLWVEWRWSAELPAWWRLPGPLRVLLPIALAADLLMGFWIPFVAGGAHLGGFAAGLLATALLTRRGPAEPQGPLVYRLASAVVVCTALAMAGATLQLSVGDYAARHLERVARLPGVPPQDLNNAAWYVALDEEATRDQLEAALHLAERAVEETDGREANILDTLAEVQFQLGRTAQAIAAIDRAIEQEPDEPYYREQRRRFTGERAADDRPTEPLLRGLRPEPPLELEGEGLQV